MAKKLKLDRDFVPCPESEGDELFANGIFEFNITKMIEHIRERPGEFVPEEIAVDDFNRFEPFADSKLESIRIGDPVIIAEIAPGKYNLIDGNHRMEKARRLGIKSILAYRLTVDHHVRFLTERKAYETYIEYWNGKLRDM
ncbi:MAG: ParB/Srx family N-terminal domain-containing protein [Candidatus Omnitrophota bacterium]